MKKNVKESKMKKQDPEKMNKADLIDRLKKCEELLQRTAKVANDLQTENKALHFHAESSRLMIATVLKKMNQSKLNVSKQYLSDIHEKYYTDISEKDGRIYFDLCKRPLAKDEQEKQVQEQKDHSRWN